MKLLNGAEIQKKLEAKGRKLAGQDLRKALRAGCKPIRKEAQSLCPVKTGLVRKSIKVAASKRKRPGVIAIVVRLSSKGAAFYGRFLSDGWRQVASYMIPGKGFFSRPRGTGPFKQHAGLKFIERAGEIRAAEAVQVVRDTLAKLNEVDP